MKINFETSMHRQRFMLGIICGLLPICCVLFGLIGAENAIMGKGWWYSISATFYCNSNIWMIGSLILASFFFLTYRGHDLGDFVLTNISSVAALGIVVFPMTAPLDRVGLFMLPPSVSHILHCIFASILFVSFDIMILTQFTKGRDKTRNIIYYVCGALIAAAILNQALASIFNYPGYWTIINEFIMLEAFAVAWITKSQITFTKLK